HLRGRHALESHPPQRDGLHGPEAAAAPRAADDRRARAPRPPGGAHAVGPEAAARGLSGGHVASRRGLATVAAGATPCEGPRCGSRSRRPRPRVAALANAPRLGASRRPARMAEAVEHAFESERHLFVEAGTGTGKTLAYLVPAVLSGRKVIISTATRALQEQIFAKDLPVVAEALEAHGVRFRATLMKGLSNYVCLRRMNEAKSAGRGLDADLARIFDWVGSTETGDRA